MKKLPIGVSTFVKIRNDCYTYVDKTAFVVKLAENGNFYFLSRPRRFGKSLFLDTLAEAFSGNRELFKGLYIYENWDWNTKFPVLKISFGAGVTPDRITLDQKLQTILKDIALQNDLQWSPELLSDQFRHLIEGLHRKTGQPVVVLVDEYDKPILDNITNPAAMVELREGLKNFYSVIKDCDAHVKFCFLTGVSKFSKVSIFSGLNNLKDITLDARYGSICGYTQEELENVFEDRLQGQDLAQIKTWYNGYNFMGSPVYNPFDVLLYLDSLVFHNYWFETGTPEFLVKLMMKGKVYIPSLENLSAGDELLSSFDIENVSAETLLFQTGYLTIKAFEQYQGFRSYQLGWPNLEVKTSLTGSLLTGLLSSPRAREDNRTRMFHILRNGELDSLRDLFHAFFASIPNDWYRKNQLAGYEGYYASIFYCYFAALGLEMAAEDTTNMGRIDLWIRLENRIYIFEFKVVEMCHDTDLDSVSKITDGAQVCSALRQLRKRRYHEKFIAPGQEVFLIGAEFSRDNRNITVFQWERV